MAPAPLAAVNTRCRSVTGAPDPIEVWQAVLIELRAIRQALEQPRRPSHLTRTDRDRLAKILTAIAGAIGSELFLVRELFEHESAGLRLVLADLNAKQLGRLLQRAEGAIVGGFTVQRDGSECGSVLWRVLATL
jgi:hypothetical protein